MSTSNNNIGKSEFETQNRIVAFFFKLISINKITLITLNDSITL